MCLNIEDRKLLEKHYDFLDALNDDSTTYFYRNELLFRIVESEKWNGKSYDSVYSVDCFDKRTGAHLEHAKYDYSDKFHDFIDRLKKKNLYSFLELAWNARNLMEYNNQNTDFYDDLKAANIKKHFFEVFRYYHESEHIAFARRIGTGKDNDFVKTIITRHILRYKSQFISDVYLSRMLPPETSMSATSSGYTALPDPTIESLVIDNEATNNFIMQYNADEHLDLVILSTKPFPKTPPPQT